MYATSREQASKIIDSMIEQEMQKDAGSDGCRFLPKFHPNTEVSDEMIRPEVDFWHDLH